MSYFTLKIWSPKKAIVLYDQGGSGVTMGDIKENILSMLYGLKIIPRKIPVSSYRVNFYYENKKEHCFITRKNVMIAEILISYA